MGLSPYLRPIDRYKRILWWPFSVGWMARRKREGEEQLRENATTEGNGDGKSGRRVRARSRKGDRVPRRPNRAVRFQHGDGDDDCDHDDVFLGQSGKRRVEDECLLVNRLRGRKTAWFSVPESSTNQLPFRITFHDRLSLSLHVGYTRVIQNIARSRYLRNESVGNYVK